MSGPDARRVVDDGLQGERTALAWDRTALAVAANGALLLRAGVVEVDWARAVGLVTLALAGVLLVVARARYVRRDASLRDASRPPGAAAILGVGVGVVSLSLVVLTVVVAAGA